MTTYLLRLLITIFINSVALYLVDKLFVTFHVASFKTAILASIVLSILNVMVKPVLIVLTLPITIITFGLFLIVINAVILMVTQSLMGSEFIVSGFGTAIIASIVISFITLILNKLVQPLK